MDLLSRARVFIDGSASEDADAILRDCISDGGAQALAAVQLLAEDMYGGETYNFYRKAPNAYALVRWGERGLDALVEMATRSPKSKNISLCLSVLAAVAAGAGEGRLEGFVRDQSVLEAVRSVTDGNEDLRRAAHARLTSFVLAFETEAEAVSVIAQQMLVLRDQDVAAAREIFSALAARWLALSDVTLGRYGALIDSSPDDEPAFQSFFEAHPQLLDPAAMTVWPEPNLMGAKKPDFVVRRTDNTYLVVEIETPGKSLVTRENQLSAEATHAVTQALEYRSFLTRRFEIAQATFPEFQEPECLVVVGTERSLSEDQRRALARVNQSYQGLRVVGFDWIQRRGETVARNVIRKMSTEPRVRII